MKGKIIVLDGMDGTGKETQSKLLFERLKKIDDKILLYHFPNYENDSSYFVKKYLKEGYCRDIDNPMLHDIFYAIDRAISFNKDIKEKYEQGYTIIFDRYTISNAIFRKTENRLDHIHAISKIEHEYLKLPIPDINILLYSNPSISMNLIENRCKINGVEKDLNENIKIQEDAFRNIIYIDDYCHILDRNNRTISPMGPVECLLIHDDNGRLYDREIIHEAIINIIFEYI